MSTSRRSILATAGAGLAAGALGTPALAATPAHLDDGIAALVERSAAANAALMQGDLDTYRANAAITADFTLMSPFGGKPTHGRDLTPERWQSVGRFFRNGSFSQELVAAYGSADMVVLALVERTDAEVGGMPAQDWALRVTLVFRREGTEWRLAHRHADPLVAGISLERAAALGRGDG